MLQIDLWKRVLIWLVCVTGLLLALPGAALAEGSLRVRADKQDIELGDVVTLTIRAGTDAGARGQLGEVGEHRLRHRHDAHAERRDARQPRDEARVGDGGLRRERRSRPTPK